MGSVAQTGPGGIGQSNGNSALELWLDADDQVFTDKTELNSAKDNSRIRLWKDKSGNGLHAKVRADSSRPTLERISGLLNDAHFMHFNRNNGPGNKQNFLVIDTFPKSSSYTIFCVFHALSPGGGNNISPVKSAAFNFGHWYGGSGLLDSDASGIGNDLGLSLCNTSVALGGGDSDSLKDFTIKSPVEINKSHWIKASFSETDVSLSLEKNDGTTNSLLGPHRPRNAASRLAIGSTGGFENNTIENYFDGYIAFLAMYSKLLNEAEKIIMTNFLSAKYNISLSDNDVYIMDEISNGNFDFEVAGIGKSNDGSLVTDAKGEGIIRIANPVDLSLRNRFMFWGHNGVSLSAQNNTDVNRGVAYRLSRLWAVSETGGDLGRVDISIDTNTIKVSHSRNLLFLADLNSNDIFADETSVPFVKTGGFYVLKGVNLSDKTKFTLGVSEQSKLPTDISISTNDVMTPNGDGVSDTYWIEGPGMVKIFDKYGHLIRELQSPFLWDGTNGQGQLVEPGYYLLTIGERERKGLNVLH